MSPAPSKNLLILLSAPSGAGKTTLCQQLLATSPNLGRAVTCTTRKPRPGEREGVDYYFLGLDEFEQKVAKGDFLEHANVYGNRYGTLKSEVLSGLRSGVDVILNIDVQGAESIRETAARDPELRTALVSVFLTPASVEILEHRLRKRGTDSEEAIARRLATAREELTHWEHFDYLLISTSVEEDLRRMNVILEAERMRQSRSPNPMGL